MTVYINRRFILRKLFFLLSYIIVSPKGFASNQKYLEKIIKKKHTGDEISICLKELKSGKVLSSFDKDKRLPIASVAKALTASYSLETLGKNYKFKTSLSLDGKIVDKSINGDLYLIGGADPLLSVDDLYKLAFSLKKRGIENINGKFFVDDTILKSFSNIDNSQPPEASYNPGFSGLNLNENKVFFKWKKKLDTFDVNYYVIGVGKKYTPENIKIFLKKNQKPSFIHDINLISKTENWKILISILNKNGGRWLPVSLTSVYCSNIFFSICQDIGINIPKPIFKKSPKNIKEISFTLSENLNEILKKMLKKSTNVTAEIVGIFSAKIWGIKINSIIESGRLMSAWFNIVTKTSNQKIYNHSGLSSDSKVSGYAFSKFLSRETSKNNLIPILKKYKKIEKVTKKIKDKKIKIVAKTGTMFFIRGLAGYIIIDEEPYASFTILFANNYLREKIKNKSSGRPKGSKTWLSRNKILEKKIIEYWVKSI